MIMMKVKLTDGTIIEVKEPRESHQIEYLDLVEQTEKGKISTKDAIQWQNNMIRELTELTEEQLSQMSLVDKAKIKSAIISRYTIIGPCSQQSDF